MNQQNCGSAGTFVLFNRYNVGRELGKGTYGVVKQAYDVDLERNVAIKCIHLGDEGIPSTALREISLLRDLKHQNCTELYDVEIHKKNTRAVHVL